MPLWTDLIDPVEATAIARDEQYLIEQAKGGTLARFLPNVFVESDHVKFNPNGNGLVDAASYRAFNARPETGKGEGVTSKTIDLPAVSRTEPIDEMTQKELARLSDTRVKKGVDAAIRRNVRALAQRQWWAQGRVIHDGSLIVSQGNFKINDVFGRDAALAVAAGAGQWWADAAVDRLEATSAWNDVYASFNDGQGAGRMVFGSRAAYNAFAKGNQFKTLVGSASRPPLATEVEQYTASAGLPDFEIFDRSVSLNGTLTKVLDPKCVYLLPEPVDPFAEEGSLLGATYWGRTVSSTYESWAIESDEQPGIVCGVFKEEKVGSSIEVEGDSIAEPVAANPNASMRIQVLA